MEIPDSSSRWTRLRARLTSRPLRILAAVVVFVIGGGILRNALGIEWSTEGVRNLVAEAGAWAPLTFITLLVFRLLLVIPSMLLLPAGGLLFGTLEGSIYGTIGLTLSGLLNYGFVKWAGPESFRARSSPRFQGILEIARSRFGALAVAVISGYPFGPITVSHLGAAMAGMGFLTFFTAVAAGSVVRAATFSFFGASIVESEHLVWASIVLAATFLVPLLIPRSRHWLKQSFGIQSGSSVIPERSADPDTGRDI